MPSWLVVKSNVEVLLKEKTERTSTIRTYMNSCRLTETRLWDLSKLVFNRVSGFFVSCSKKKKQRRLDWYPTEELCDPRKGRVNVWPKNFIWSNFQVLVNEVRQWPFTKALGHIFVVLRREGARAPVWPVVVRPCAVTSYHPWTPDDMFTLYLLACAWTVRKLFIAKRWANGLFTRWRGWVLWFATAHTHTHTHPPHSLQLFLALFSIDRLCFCFCSSKQETKTYRARKVNAYGVKHM